VSASLSDFLTVWLQATTPIQDLPARCRIPFQAAMNGLVQGAAGKYFEQSLRGIVTSGIHERKWQFERQNSGWILQPES
jgi:hypothetical protein